MTDTVEVDYRGRWTCPNCEHDNYADLDFTEEFPEVGCSNCGFYFGVEV